MILRELWIKEIEVWANNLFEIHTKKVVDKTIRAIERHLDRLRIKLYLQGDFRETLWVVIVVPSNEKKSNRLFT